jgi:hypothetical protein
LKAETILEFASLLPAYEFSNSIWGDIWRILDLADVGVLVAAVRVKFKVMLGFLATFEVLLNPHPQLVGIHRIGRPFSLESLPIFLSHKYKIKFIFHSLAVYVDLGCDFTV